MFPRCLARPESYHTKNYDDFPGPHGVDREGGVGSQHGGVAEKGRRLVDILSSAMSSNWSEPMSHLSKCALLMNGTFDGAQKENFEAKENGRVPTCMVEVYRSRDLRNRRSRSLTAVLGGSAARSGISRARGRHRGYRVSAASSTMDADTLAVSPRHGVGGCVGRGLVGGRSVWAGTSAFSGLLTPTTRCQAPQRVQAALAAGSRRPMATEHAANLEVLACR